MDYYKEEEIFEIMGKNMEFSEDNKIVTRIYITGSSNAFGEVESTNNCIYQ